MLICPKSVRVTEHMNATAPTAILSVIQVLSELIWSMRREQIFRHLPIIVGVAAFSYKISAQRHRQLSVGV